MDAAQATMDLTPPAPSIRRHRSFALLIGVAVAAVAMIAAAISLAQIPSSDASIPARQLVSLQRACQDRAAGPAPSIGLASGSASCAVMTKWMKQQLRGGHMTRTAMWGNSINMSATCRRWMATGPQAATSNAETNAWCDGMVTSMTQHVGDWDNWMMSGHMMGQ